MRAAATAALREHSWGRAWVFPIFLPATAGPPPPLHPRHPRHPPCNTNTRYVLGPNKSVSPSLRSSHRAPTRLGRYPTIVPGASTEYLSTPCHPRCRCPGPGPRSVFNNGRAARCRSVLILRPRRAPQGSLHADVCCARLRVRTRVCRWILTIPDPLVDTCAFVSMRAK